MKKRGFLSEEMFRKLKEFYIAKKTEIANERRSAKNTTKFDRLSD